MSWTPADGKELRALRIALRDIADVVLAEAVEDEPALIPYEPGVVIDHPDTITAVVDMLTELTCGIHPNGDLGLVALETEMELDADNDPTGRRVMTLITDGHTA